MRTEDILGLPSMPPAAPSYPRGPYRFIDRQHMVIVYESDPEAIRQALPEPLEPLGLGQVCYEWMAMPDSSGFGRYVQCGISIPCRFAGQEASFIAQMYLDNTAPISGGREIWGFPQKHAEATLAVASDTLTGTLVYSGQKVAVGSMAYKHAGMAREEAGAAARLARPRINLKLIPDVDGTPAICQLVAVTFEEVELKGSWSGAGRLDLAAHVNAPLADLPVHRIVEAHHFLADVTLPWGRVVHDYLKD